MAVECVGLDVPVKFGDSRSNRSRDIRAAHFATADDVRTNGLISIVVMTLLILRSVDLEQNRTVDQSSVHFVGDDDFTCASVIKRMSRWQRDVNSRIFDISATSAFNSIL